jgi:hypothetical protein
MARRAPDFFPLADFSKFSKQQLREAIEMAKAAWDAIREHWGVTDESFVQSITVAEPPLPAPDHPSS